MVLAIFWRIPIPKRYQKLEIRPPNLQGFSINSTSPNNSLLVLNESTTTTETDIFQETIGIDDDTKVQSPSVKVLSLSGQKLPSYSTGSPLFSKRSPFND